MVYYLNAVPLFYSNFQHAQGNGILENDATKDWEGDIEENSTEPWEYDSEYYAKRGLIKSSQVDKLHKAMGHAAQKMPRLRRLKFSFRGEIGEAGSNEYLDFSRDLATGRTRLNINTEWQYTMGEGLISAWGLKGEKADEFRDT